MQALLTDVANVYAGVTGYIHGISESPTDNICICYDLC